MAKTETKEAPKVHLLPPGRLINHSLFVKDAYVDDKGREAVPSYKIEMAFEPGDVEGEGLFDELLAEAAVRHWGESAWDDFFAGKIKSPLLDGDKLAAKRERKGKPGDAYKGKKVLRAKTIYNKDGVDGPGGVQVFDEAVKEIGAGNMNEIYQGCFGQVAVTINCYEDNDGDPAMSCYLSAFQKTGDGERLVTPKDHSTLFKPVGRTAAAANGEAPARRRRAG